ncbi:MAG: hypothetical protein JST00_40960 [Deltaproteobacteria bacterium]|nr:hypothetical protein [Deltaproteobacteria bacterium]
MRVFALCLLSVVSASVVACGGSVTTNEEPDPGKIVMCSEPLGDLSLSLSRSKVPLEASAEFDASIVGTSPGQLVLDTCSPAADCIASEAVVSVAGPRVDLTSLPAGAFVHVSWEVAPTGWGGPNKRVVVRSITAWAGLPNPAATGDAVLFAASAGFSTPGTATLPFVIDKAALECPATADACANGKRYAFTVASGAHAVKATRVSMGQSLELDVAGTVPYLLKVTNLRSYDSKCPDDYWNWSWFSVWVPKGV